MRNKESIEIRGHYKLATEFMRSKQVYTKQDVIDFYVKEIGVTEKVAEYSAIILLSPRKESKYGDCRGSTSNPWGHLVYNDKLPRKFDVTTGKLEAQRYRFKYRQEIMEPRKYPYQVRRIEQERLSNTTRKHVKKARVEVAI